MWTDNRLTVKAQKSLGVTSPVFSMQSHTGLTLTLRLIFCCPHAGNEAYFCPFSSHYLLKPLRWIFLFFCVCGNFALKIYMHAFCRQFYLKQLVYIVLPYFVMLLTQNYYMTSKDLKYSAQITWTTNMMLCAFLVL